MTKTNLDAFAAAVRHLDDGELQAMRVYLADVSQREVTNRHPRTARVFDVLLTATEDEREHRLAIYRALGIEHLCPIEDLATLMAVVRRRQQAEGGKP